MGNRRLNKIECLYRLGTLESERLKVTALNLFHPTAPVPFLRGGLFMLRHSLLDERLLKLQQGVKAGKEPGDKKGSELRAALLP
jgi:hypothetical protein